MSTIDVQVRENEKQSLIALKPGWQQIRKILLCLFPLFVTPLYSQAPVVCLSYFDNPSASRELDPLKKGIVEMLITDLKRINTIRLVERERFELIQKELDLGKSAYLDPKTAQKLGRGLGAQYVLTGSFLVQGTTIRIDTRLVRIETGEIVMAETISGEKSNFLALPKKLSDLIIKNLGVVFSKDERTTLGESANGSLQAALTYSKALEQLDQGDTQGARSLLQGALREAPEFPSALRLKDLLDAFLSVQDDILVKEVGNKLLTIRTVLAGDCYDKKYFERIKSLISSGAGTKSLKQPAVMLFDGVEHLDLDHQALLAMYFGSAYDPVDLYLEAYAENQQDRMNALRMDFGKTCWIVNAICRDYPIRESYSGTGNGFLVLVNNVGESGCLDWFLQFGFFEDALHVVRCLRENDDWLFKEIYQPRLGVIRGLPKAMADSPAEQQLQALQERHSKIDGKVYEKGPLDQTELSIVLQAKSRVRRLAALDFAEAKILCAQMKFSEASKLLMDSIQRFGQVLDTDRDCKKDLAALRNFLRKIRADISDPASMIRAKKDAELVGLFRNQVERRIGLFIKDAGGSAWAPVPRKSPKP